MACKFIFNVRQNGTEISFGYCPKPEHSLVKDCIYKIDTKQLYYIEKFQDSSSVFGYFYTKNVEVTNERHKREINYDLKNMF